MTNKTQIAELRELSKKVSQGKWWMDSHGEALVCFSQDRDIQIILKPEHLREKAHRDENTGGLSYWPNDSDASWIVATQPKNILSLLDQLEATQGGAAEAIRDCLRLKESLKAVTEELAEEKEHSANFEREANLYHGKCEAAEARIAELEINWEASKRAIGFYKKEIAKLKGDAVPVGEVRLSDYDDCGQRSAQVVCLHAQADWNNFPDGTKLFTHAQPVPVVVLPHVQREFVNQLRDIAATYGNTQQLRAHLSKAVDKFVAGITVKSTDSEGA